MLIAFALVGGVYLHFNPAWPVLAILAFGVYMVGRISGPALPPVSPCTAVRATGSISTRTTSGVTGSDRKDRGGSNDDDGSRC